MEATVKNIWEFVREIRNYYQRQISELRFQAIMYDDVNGEKEKQIKLFSKVILQIDNLLVQINEVNIEYEMWRSKNSGFSFSEDLNADKLEEVYFKVYELLKQIKQINILDTLSEIIDNKIRECKKLEKLEEGDRAEFMEFYAETIKKYASVIG